MIHYLMAAPKIDSNIYYVDANGKHEHFNCFKIVIELIKDFSERFKYSRASENPLQRNLYSHSQRNDGTWLWGLFEELYHTKDRLDGWTLELLNKILDNLDDRKHRLIYYKGYVRNEALSPALSSLKRLGEIPARNIVPFSYAHEGVRKTGYKEKFDRSTLHRVPRTAFEGRWLPQRRVILDSQDSNDGRSRVKTRYPKVSRTKPLTALPTPIRDVIVQRREFRRSTGIPHDRYVAATNSAKMAQRWIDHNERAKFLSRKVPTALNFLRGIADVKKAKDDAYSKYKQGKIYDRVYEPNMRADFERRYNKPQAPRTVSRSSLKTLSPQEMKKVYEDSYLMHADEKHRAEMQNKFAKQNVSFTDMFGIPRTSITDVEVPNDFDIAANAALDRIEESNLFNELHVPNTSIAEIDV